MKKALRLALILLLAGAGAFAARAQGAPVGKPLNLGPKSGPDAIRKVAPPPQVSTQDDAALIQKANAWFNSNLIMSADFTQMSPSGRKSTGRLYVQKPGKLRFTYDPPATIDITADGTSLAIRDKKDPDHPNVVYLWQTPLKFLLKDRIDIAKDTKVLGVQNSPAGVTITIEDSATLGGVSRIRLVFDPQGMVLRQWTVTDPQGYDTTVSLTALDFKTKPDPALFKISVERFN